MQHTGMVYIYVHHGENRYGRPCRKKWEKEKNNKLQGLLHDWAFCAFFFNHEQEEVVYGKLHTPVLVVNVVLL
jgi:hypothetical protein